MISGDDLVAMCLVLLFISVGVLTIVVRWLATPSWIDPPPALASPTR